MEPAEGLEPPTLSLQGTCTANCATPAWHPQQDSNPQYPVRSRAVSSVSLWGYVVGAEGFEPSRLFGRQRSWITTSPVSITARLQCLCFEQDSHLCHIMPETNQNMMFSILLFEGWYVTVTSVTLFCLINLAIALSVPRNINQLSFPFTMPLSILSRFL